MICSCRIAITLCHQCAVAQSEDTFGGPKLHEKDVVKPAAHTYCEQGRSVIHIRWCIISKKFMLFPMHGHIEHESCVAFRESTHGSLVLDGGLLCSEQTQILLLVLLSGRFKVQITQILSLYLNKIPYASTLHLTISVSLPQTPQLCLNLLLHSETSSLYLKVRQCTLRFYLHRIDS